jgi:hypothetical protein
MDEARLAAARAQGLEPGLSVRSVLTLGFAAKIADKLIGAHRSLGLPE